MNGERDRSPRAFQKERGVGREIETCGVGREIETHRVGKEVYSNSRSIRYMVNQKRGIQTSKTTNE